MLLLFILVHIIYTTPPSRYARTLCSFTTNELAFGLSLFFTLPHKNGGLEMGNIYTCIVFAPRGVHDVTHLKTSNL
jgi:hypothetical protein